MAHFNLFVVLVALLVCFTLAEEKYSNKYENFDLDKVLNTDSLATSYINCLLDKESCTEEGQAFKNILPDSLKTNCSKCTDVQKKNIEKITTFLVKNRPADFDILAAKYDPTGEYRKRLDKIPALKAAAV